MTDFLLFLLIFGAPAVAFILLLHFCPGWAARIVVWGSVIVVLLAEWQFFVLSSQLAQSNLGFLLRALTCVLTTVAALTCLLVSRISALRRRCNNKWVVYLLFGAAYGLPFLHGAQVLDSVLDNVCPWAEDPLGADIGLTGCLLFTFLLLWQLGVCALAAHLDTLRRSPRRLALK